MPTLLYLGVGGQGGAKRFVAEGLVAHGYRLVVLAERIPAWIEPLAQFAAEVEATGPTALDRAVAIGRAQHVDGVFTGDEVYVELAARVARRLGLPGLTDEATELCRDKHAMRRRLAREGIPAPRSLLATGLAEACDAAETIGYPVVLKPRNLGGSIGVVRAESAEDVDRFFAVTSAASLPGVTALSGMLVEECIEGPEYSVESVTANGETTICGITEQVLAFPPYFEEIGQYARPVDLTNPLDARLADLTARVHRAFGITVGVTHCEILDTAKGPYVVEIAARLGGDRIPVITKLASGIDLVSAGAAAAVGDLPDLRPTRARVAGVRMVYPPHRGVVARLDARRVPPGLLWDMGWYATSGQFVALPPEAFLSRLAYLIATDETRAAVARRLDEAQAALDIEIDAAPARHAG